MNWARALSSAVRALGLHPKGRPFKSDSAHQCHPTPFSRDLVQWVRTLPLAVHCHGRSCPSFHKQKPRITALIMIFSWLNLHQFRGVVNHTVMLPNTLLVCAQHDERSPGSKYLRHSGASGHGGWGLLDGTARMDVREVLLPEFRWRSYAKWKMTATITNFRAGDFLGSDQLPWPLWLAVCR